MPSWRWAATCGESPRKEVKGARSGSSLFEEASSTKPETASSIYSASSRLDGVVDRLPARPLANRTGASTDVPVEWRARRQFDARPLLRVRAEANQIER